MPYQVSRGLAFEKRFLEWFTVEGLLGQARKEQQVRKKVGAGHRETFYDLVKDEQGRPVLDQNGEPRRRLSRDEFSGRKGRIDVLLTVRDDVETIKVIIELKSTDWSRMRPESVRRNVARHAAQLYSYQGHLTRDMWDEDKQEWVPSGETDAVQMFLVYEQKPADGAVAEEIVALCGGDAIQVVWFDDLV
jgi:hypothetical protein